MFEKIVIGIVALGILVFLTIKSVEKPSYEMSECLKEKKLEFSGIVDTIIQDKKNLSQSIIVLTSGRKVLPDYTYGLWIEAREGDSIVKKKGKLNYLIYRGGNKKLLKKLNWDKKCGDL